MQHSWISLGNGKDYEMGRGSLPARGTRLWSTSSVDGEQSCPKKEEAYSSNRPDLQDVNPRDPGKDPHLLLSVGL